MPAISQKGRRQSDEKATLIYYQKKKKKTKQKHPTEFYGIPSIKGKSKDDFKWR